MASVVTTGDRRRIDFKAPDGKRKTIRLGKVSLKAANAVRLQVERLVASLITGAAPPDETSRWVAGLSGTLADRLARAGLVEHQQQVESVGLIQYVDQYIGKRADVKSATVTIWRRCRNHLKRHFGNMLLTDVTLADAKAFRRYLVAKGLAESTIRKTCGFARQFCQDAVDGRLIDSNPFADKSIPTAARGNGERYHFVSVEDIDKVLDACPDAEWRAIVALSRFGGLRCPSEVLALKWSDIDWTGGQMRVTSAKTEHHQGKGSRIVPLYPELEPVLLEASEQAKPGAVYVISEHRGRANLRTRFQRIIGRAGLEPWPKLFQNLRSTRQTELEESFPSHVVCAWQGNSERIARQHYLQITTEHFERATGKPQQKPQQSQAVPNHPEPSPVIATIGKTPENQDWTLKLRGFCTVPEWRIGDSNSSQDQRKNAPHLRIAAQSAALEAETAICEAQLAAVAERWELLPDDVRDAIVKLACDRVPRGTLNDETEQPGPDEPGPDYI